MKRVIVESPFAAPSAKEPCVCCPVAEHPVIDGVPQGVRHVMDRCWRCFRVEEELLQNKRYLYVALRDCFNRGEAPFASHVIGPLVLDDTKPEERKLGMEAGFAWGRVAELVAVYTDRGVSPGMEAGMLRATAHGISIEMRSLPGWR